MSTPLPWAEVRKGLAPSRFTIKTVPARVEKFGDLWEGVMGDGVDVIAMVERTGRRG